MRKKIFKILLSFVLVFTLSFAYKTNIFALKWSSGLKPHVCLYQNENGERIGISSNGEKVDAIVLDDFTVYKDGKEKGIINAGETAFKVYNKEGFLFDKWDPEIGCQNFLVYTEVSGADKVYSTDDSSYKSSKTRAVFALIDGYVGKTADNVSLNKIFCTYSNNKQSLDIFSFAIVFNQYNKKANYQLYQGFKLIQSQEIDGELTLGKFDSYLFDESQTQYVNNFDIRKFWDEEKNSYSCPNQIYVNQENDYNGNFLGFSIKTRYTISYGLTGEEGTRYSLEPQASYIDYKLNQINKNNKYCNYSLKPSTCKKDDRTCLDETTAISIDKDDREYFSILNNALLPGTSGKTIIFDFKNNYDFTTEDKCTVLPVIYTNCGTENSDQHSRNCYISDTYEEGYTKLYEQTWSNNKDSQTVEEQMGVYSGYRYLPLVCELKDSIKNYVGSSEIASLPKLKIYNDANTLKGEYSILDFPCKDNGISEGQKCDNEYCRTDGAYIISRKAIEVKSYCRDIMVYTAKNYDNVLYRGRYEECASFNNFYNGLVEKGIITDLAYGCDILSTDFQEKLIWLLDILKIAGPILALGLGTIDFIKAVASGDADKEMKTAFKRFSTRIAAAVLLFVVPFVLAFLMDTFLGGQEGYNPDNPFCNLVKWGD